MNKGGSLIPQGAVYYYPRGQKYSDSLSPPPQLQFVPVSEGAVLYRYTGTEKVQVRTIAREIKINYGNTLKHKIKLK